MQVNQPKNDTSRQ